MIAYLPLLSAAAPPRPDEVLAAEHEIVQQSNRGDAATLNRLLSDAYVIRYRTIDGGWHMSDKARSIRAWTRVSTATLPTILRNEKVVRSGETAVVFAEVVDRERRGAGEVRSITRVTDCFVREHGAWRLLASDEIATCAGPNCR